MSEIGLETIHAHCITGNDGTVSGRMKFLEQRVFLKTGLRDDIAIEKIGQLSLGPAPRLSLR